MCPGVQAQEGGARAFPPEQVQKGAGLYKVHCEQCHGVNMVGPPWAADLEKFPRDQRARFTDVVSFGIRNMPPWGDLLKPEEIDALWAYLVAGERR